MKLTHGWWKMDRNIKHKIMNLTSLKRYPNLALDNAMLATQKKEESTFL